MKSSTIKKVVVRCLDWEEEMDIDSSIFDDIYMEAATRSIEKRKSLPTFQLAVVMKCWEKKNADNPDMHFVYNTYFVLVNSAMHEKAEILRLNFLKEYKMDLRKESLKSKNDDGGDKNGGKPNKA